MKKQLAWILGGASIVGLGMVASLNACSGDTNPGTDGGGKDSTTKDQAVNETSTQDTGTGQDTGVQDAGPDCKSVPANAPFTTDAGPFCPFMQGADGGTTFAACTTGEHCCVYPSSAKLPSTCNAANTACSIGTDAGTADFQCQESNDCTGNQVCCLNSPPGEILQDPGCTSYDFVQKDRGTTCMASCGAGVAQICGSTADCTGGKTCFPVNTLGIWIGVCVGSDGGI